MNKVIMIIILIAYMLILFDANVNAKEIENGNNNDYAVVTVHSVYDDIWEIEYGKYVYIYKDLDYPLNTVFIIADVSGDYPVLIEPMEIGNNFQKVR